MLIPIAITLSIVAFIAGFALRKTFLGGPGDISVPARPTMDDVKRLARENRKIDAIKCYRKIHDVGLAEAKKAVEELPLTD